jgi:hypothetical protein
MHPHGVLYTKDSEGADYNDSTGGADKEDGGVPPGATHNVHLGDSRACGTWAERSEFDLLALHSHADELRDVASGLFGGIVVTRRGMALPDGRPKGVDREFVTMYIAINENESWFLDDNIRDHTTDPKGVNKEGEQSLYSDRNGRYSCGHGLCGDQRQMVDQRLHLWQHANDDDEEGRSRPVVHCDIGRLQQCAHATLAREHGLGRGPAHGCFGPDLSADDHERTWFRMRQGSGSITATSATTCWRGCRRGMR